MSTIDGRPMMDVYVRVPRGLAADVHLVGPHTDSGAGSTGRKTAMGFLGDTLPQGHWTPPEREAAARELGRAARRAEAGVRAGTIPGHLGTSRAVGGSPTALGLDYSPHDLLPERGMLHVSESTLVDVSLPRRSPAAKEILRLTQAATGTPMRAGLPTGAGVVAAGAGVALLAGTVAAGKWLLAPAK